jgi:hypothetical protein
MTAAGFELDVDGEEALLCHPGTADSIAVAKMQYVYLQIQRIC